MDLILYADVFIRIFHRARRVYGRTRIVRAQYSEAHTQNRSNLGP